MQTQSLPNAAGSKIEAIAEQVVAREGCKLYDWEFSSSAGVRILRVYIDKNIEGGATLEDCANVSRGMNLLLDVEDIIPGGKYSLEVSTPGIERPLKKKWHFEAVPGKKIWMKLRNSLQSLGIESKKYASYKQLTAVVDSCEDGGVRLKIDEENILIPFDAVEKAHVVFEFGADKGKKKK